MSVHQARSSGRTVAISAWVVVTALSIGASALSAASGRTPDVFLPLGISGIVYAASGAVMYAARPGNRAGIALLLSAALPALLVIVRYLAPVTLPINDGFGPAATLLPLVYLFLSFPSGRLPGRAEWWTFWVTVVVGCLGATTRVISLEPSIEFRPAVCQPSWPQATRLCVEPLRIEARADVDVDLPQRTVAGVDEPVPLAGRDHDGLVGADLAPLVLAQEEGRLALEREDLLLGIAVWRGQRARRRVDDDPAHPTPPCGPTNSRRCCQRQGVD